MFDWTDPLGSAISMAGGNTAPPPPVVINIGTPNQNTYAQQLYSDFYGLGMPADVAATMAAHGAMDVPAANLVVGTGGMIYPYNPAKASDLASPNPITDKLGSLVTKGADALGTIASPSGAVVNASPITGWIESNIGNYALVAFGAVLAVGALLISQRKTVKVITGTATKVGGHIATAAAAIA